MTAPLPIRERSLMDYGAAGHALDGGVESGDLYLVQPFEGGILVAVADGLGHGPGAAHAAQAAIEVLAARPSEPPARLVEACHHALRYTRGAVLSLATIDAATERMTWLGVGNVEALLLRMDKAGIRAREAIVQQAGIVGQNCPTLRPATFAVQPGDLLLLATDGIGGGFDRAVRPGIAPQQLADCILSDYGRATDDALILVARWNGRLVRDEAS